MKKAFLKISVFAVLLSLLVVPALVNAAAVPTVEGLNSLPGPDGGVNADEALYGVITTVINTVVGLLGLIAVIIVIVGGFKYMVSGGDETKAKDARKLLISGLIGLMIVIFSWLLASYVLSILYGAV